MPDTNSSDSIAAPASVAPTPGAPNPNPNQLLYNIGLEWFRHGLTILATYLIAHGLMASSDASTLVGAGLMFAPFIWSALENAAQIGSQRLALMAAAAKAKSVATKTAVLFLCFFAASCSTTQKAQFETAAKPIVLAAVAGYAQTYGVPPVLTTAIASPIYDDIWGIIAQVRAGQPAAQGAANPAVGNAVAAALPANATAGTKLALLTAAANQVATALPATSP